MPRVVRVRPYPGRHRAGLARGHTGPSAVHARQTCRAYRGGPPAGASKSCACRSCSPAPTFLPSRTTGWRQLAEPVPDGPTVRLMQDLARRHGMVFDRPGVRRGDHRPLLQLPRPSWTPTEHTGGKYRKNHLPHVDPGFWEKFYFRPGNLGYPVFNTARGKIGVYICYDRHFPEGARALGLGGAGNGLQSLSHGGRAVRVPVEAGAAGPRRGKRLLPWGPSIASAWNSRGRSESSTAAVTSAIPGVRSLPKAPATGDEVIVADLDLD